MKICLKCHNLYEPSSDTVIGNDCPIKNCNGKIVEVDQNIITVHDQLKVKGYPTTPTAVNSGSEFIEIIFDEKVHPEAFAFLPTGFISEVSNDHCLRVYKSVIGETEFERLEFIRQASIELVEWIGKLSPAKKLIADLTLTGECDVVTCVTELYLKLFLNPEDWNATAKLVTIVSPERVEFIDDKIWPLIHEIGYEFELDVNIE